MRVCAVGDLHGYWPDTPPCDLLLLPGDFGPKAELEAWLGEREARMIIGVAGNHDWFASRDGNDAARALPWTYLQDESTEFEGVTIHGSPWTSPFFDWAFMEKEEALAERWKLIKPDTDILVTHSPPYGLGDLADNDWGGDPHAGSPSLRETVEQLPNLRLHVFGHIHEGYGEGVLPLGGRWANVSLVDARYRPFQSRIKVFDL